MTSEEKSRRLEKLGFADDEITEILKRDSDEASQAKLYLDNHDERNLRIYQNDTNRDR